MYFKKIGFLHIPKCAGSSMSQSIFQHLGLSPTHISALSEEEPKKKWVVKKKSLEMRFAQNNLFLSGHLTYSDMVDLNREIIFTYLRDPLERLVSLWTFNLTRSESAQALNNDPSLRRHYGSTFKEYLEEVNPNGMSKNLLIDLIGLKEFSKITADSVNSVYSKIQKDLLVEKSLARLDFVFTKSPQEPINWLSELGYFDKFNLPRSNSSSSKQVLKAGCSRDEFRQIVKAYTYLDYSFFNHANRKFYGDFNEVSIARSIS